MREDTGGFRSMDDRSQAVVAKRIVADMKSRTRPLLEPLTTARTLAATCRRTPLFSPPMGLEALHTTQRDCASRFVVESVRAVDGP